MAIKKKNKKKFIEWFIGFAEGDGCWSVVSQPLRVDFIINHKDPKVLYKIKSVLGFGSVVGPYYSKTTGSSYFRYRAGDQKSTARLIEIFNGKLVLKKTRERFKLYVKAYNNLPRVVASGNQIFFKKSEILPTFEDGWVSGFIDAEGCFSGYVPKDWSQIDMHVNLTQKGEREVFEYLTLMLGGYISPKVYDESKQKADRIRVNRIDAVRNLINYLEAHPLQSSKHIVFVQFKKIFVRKTAENFQWSKMGRRAQARLKQLLAELNVPIK